MHLNLKSHMHLNIEHWHDWIHITGMTTITPKEKQTGYLLKGVRKMLLKRNEERK